jgi:EAL domain-containing protein (putative c-di-GMP-specific phosphodiesterase class I)
MALTRGIDQEATKQKLVGAMSTLCRDLGMCLVAEGVETRDERDTLVGLGCDLFQGYLFAKPGAPFPAVLWDAAR